MITHEENEVLIMTKKYPFVCRLDYDLFYCVELIVAPDEAFFRSSQVQETTNFKLWT